MRSGRTFLGSGGFHGGKRIQSAGISMVLYDISRGKDVSPGLDLLLKDILSEHVRVKRD
jgi:hypothetical protein